MQKRAMITLLMLFATVSLWAQTISGTITGADSKETLPQVNVVVKGTTVGTVSDLDGNFSITLPEGNRTIVLSYVGYAEQEYTLPEGQNSATVNIVLQLSDVGLNTVVVSASRSEEKILDAPASVTVIGTDKIESRTALTATDHLEGTAGVDIMQTSLTSSNVSVRGFNNIFSGSMLVIVDNRIARVPSLRVNAFQLIPTNNYDIERMELVRGPGSALYGPNAADGVLAIFTKSPLDIDQQFETIVSLTAGTRAIIAPELWHAGRTKNGKFGFKLSLGYNQGNDWEYYDPREPEIGDTIIFGSARDGNVFVVDTTEEPGIFDRNFDQQKYNGDIRFDYRPNDDIDVNVSAGISNVNGIELTGLGAAQVRNWSYIYTQTRFRWKNLFFQYFLNSSNSGDTYLIPQGSEEPHNIQILDDKSKLHVATIQHSYEPVKDRLSFIYGVDALLTRPQTDGTINGRFEEEDDVTQVGGYIQGELNATEKITFVAAGRADWHSEVDGAFISPRAAIVYKATPRHTLRATYNRAFTPPSSLNLWLDLSNGLIPNGINIRALGNPNGFNFSYDDQGLPEFIAPADGNWYSVGDQTNNHVYFDQIMGIIGAGLADQAPDNIKPLVPILISQLTKGIAGDTGTIQGVGHETIDYVNFLDAEGTTQQRYTTSAYDISKFKDRKAMDNSITQTWEIGYKGIIADRLFVTADFYWTKQSDFVSPLTNITASVMYDPSQLRAALGPEDTTGLLYNNLQPFDGQLIPLLDGNPDYGTGVANGTAYDELVNIVMGAAAQIPIGSVTPVDDKVNTDVILTYVNLGEVSVGGMDLSFNFLVTEELSIAGAYSYVTKDRIALDGAQGGFIALNAPQHKTALSAEYNWKDIGLSTRLAWRWTDGFPANSSVYIGDVEDIHLLDFTASYNLPFSKNTKITLDIKNLTNNETQRFPGTPPIGIMVLGRITHTFKYGKGAAN